MTIRHRTVVRSVPLPSPSLADGALRSVDFADAYEVTLPPGADRDPATWVRAVFASPPAWVGRAFRARNAVVAPLGLKRPTRQSLESGFPELARDDHEILLGLDDRHLDFRASVLIRTGGDGAPVLVISTVVHYNNLLGRAYFAVVRLVHPAVVRAMMRRAVGQSRPRNAVRASPEARPVPAGLDHR